MKLTWLGTRIRYSNVVGKKAEAPHLPNRDRRRLRSFVSFSVTLVLCTQPLSKNKAKQEKKERALLGFLQYLRENRVLCNQRPDT